MNVIRHAGPVLMAALMAACASASPGSAGGNVNVITSAQLAELQDMTAMEAIRRLRPQWLRRRTLPGPVRGATGDDMYPEVHVDGSRQLDMEVLQSISVQQVREMRFVPGTEATTRFGTGYTNGVILVETHRR